MSISTPYHKLAYLAYVYLRLDVARASMVATHKFSNSEPNVVAGFMK